MRYRVLVIDDDKLARNGLISIVPWEECGMEVVGDVANGMAALEFLKSHSVDLAVVDLSMPVLSGMDFIRESRKLYPELQYVVLSFHESFEYVQGAMRLGAVDYISKLRLEQEDCKEVFMRVARLLGCREGDRSTEEGVSSQTLEELRQEWESLQWVYDDTRFQEQGERLQKLGISPLQAERLAAWTASALESAFGGHFSLPDRFDSVEGCLNWLKDTRSALYRQGEGDGGIPSCMLRAVLYIKEHLREPLKAELVAEAVGMSRGYFSTTFKKHTGLTFNDYVRRQRVFLAQELLEQNAVLPGDVSAEVGYEDSKYFGRIFQEQTGMTCSAYWRQMSQGRKK